MPCRELPPEAIWGRNAVRKPYKSDLTEAQWDFVRPILPPIRAKNGFVPIRKRWVVERTFGWLMTNRRCVREYERRVWSSESRVKVAAIGMMLRRLRYDEPTKYDVDTAAGYNYTLLPANAA